jgi:hypothetical protein
MKKISSVGMVGGVLAAGAGIMAYHKFVRPWHLRWGASDEELSEKLPGDNVKPDAKNQVTHAITINAPPSDVWRWLVQIGQDRGGFFSYDWIENIFGLGIHNADRIVPELQKLNKGDFVRSAHRGWLGGRFDEMAGWYVVELVPERALVLRDEIEHGSWAFILKPIDDQQTRMIIRARGNQPQTAGAKLFSYGFFEPAHFIMERKMLLTLKELAESNAENRPTVDTGGSKVNSVAA